MGQHLLRLVIFCFLPGAIYGMQECYVCRPDEERSPELEKQFPNAELPICGTKTPERKVCPEGSKGCLTQYEGDRVTKSCSELFVNDCSQANRVKYCYCVGTLCNKEEKTITVTPETDDEDLSEGSGDSTTTMTTQPTTTITTTKPIIKKHHASTSSALTAPWLTIAMVIYIFPFLN
ncbi:uncharacterized protein [Halyomorpha halys]|uniref:uncharacterized protein n=1 Tax=Halyomorpha halys TaxID=286706 RepID=UPI0006D4E10A|nr:uncharacterized protein LOC106683479 [Halyomorpha halys]